MSKKRGRPRKNETENSIEDIADIINPTIEQIVPEIVASALDKTEEHGNNVIEFCSTGSDLFDLIGGGGLPWGKMVNIVGDNSTGKTLLASEIIAAAYKKYGKDLEWHYDDAEAGYSFDSKRIWGIDIVAEDSKCSETLEEFQANFDKLLDKLKPGKRLIYILDSFDSLTTLEELTHFDKKAEAIEKGKKIPGTYGQSKSKGSSEFFRVMKRKVKDKNCLLIIISQVRENIGVMFGAKYARMGGKALDFYPAQVFWLAVSEKHGDKKNEEGEKIDGRITGISIKIKNTKNKVGKPFRSGIIDIIFDYGVDNIGSNLCFLYDLKTPKEGRNIDGFKTKKIIWDGKEFTHRRLIRYIEKNNLENELTERVKKKWEEIENNSDVAKDRKPKY